MQLSDDFASNVMSLTYDNNGNLTDEGVLRYVYDAWNRLRKANRYESSSQDTTTIGAYEYYPDNRRSEKVVTSCGVEETAGDGGNTTVRYYYGGLSPSSLRGFVASSLPWNIVETRNGSNQATRQWVWGTQYMDEPILMDVNGDPTESNDCDPDDQAGESTADQRYFYVQDRQPLTRRGPRRGHGRSATAELRSGRCVKGNWNVVAVTGYDPTGEGGGNVVERYSYTPYGSFLVLKGGTSELGNVLPTSTVGSPFTHQGLPFDAEKGSYHGGGPDAYVSGIGGILKGIGRFIVGLFPGGCTKEAEPQKPAPPHTEPFGWPDAETIDWLCEGKKGVHPRFPGKGRQDGRLKTA